MARDVQQLVVFALDRVRYALPLSAVERIVRAADITPLPKVPAIVLGVINVQGRIIPVVNVRKRFRLPEREVRHSDQFVVAYTSRRPVALVADTVTGVLECPVRDVVAAGSILPGTAHVHGVVRLQDGLVLIHDLDSFLSLKEEKSLKDALRGEP